MERIIKLSDLSRSGKELDEMKHGDSVFIPESDYGFGYIYKINFDYKFLEIPMYGGEPTLCKTFSVFSDGVRECVKYLKKYHKEFKWKII